MSSEAQPVLKGPLFNGAQYFHHDEPFELYEQTALQSPQFGMVRRGPSAYNPECPPPMISVNPKHPKSPLVQGLSLYQGHQKVDIGAGLEGEVVTYSSDEVFRLWRLINRAGGSRQLTQKQLSGAVDVLIAQGYEEAAELASILAHDAIFKEVSAGNGFRPTAKSGRPNTINLGKLVEQFNENGNFFDLVVVKPAAEK